MRKKLLCAQMILLTLLLAACGGEEAGRDGAQELALTTRTEYLAMTSCSAKLALTADYGERVYDYGFVMSWQKEGGLLLTVTAPEDVAGVTIRAENGATALEYDGARIETGPVTPDGLSPVDALPAFLQYAKAGFMAACTEELLGETAALRVDYREPDATPGEGVEGSLWFDATTHALLRGELSDEGRVVVQCTFSEFQMA